MIDKNFKENLELVLQDEGVYSNDLHDPGGETVYGIARNYHPGWQGWELIDEFKRYFDTEEQFKRHIEASEEIKKLVRVFYYREFWKRLHLDKLNDYPALQKKLFNVAVNKGVQKTAMFLQRALNILNKNEKYYPDLIIDGLIGRKTLAALRKIEELGKIKNLEWWLETIIRSDYLKSTERDKKKERFAYGWANRLRRLFS